MDLISISGITTAGLIKKYGLIEATHKYAEQQQKKVRG